MFFDPQWLLFLLLVLGVTVLAHWRIKVIVRETSRYGVRSGATGFDAASAVLQSASVNAVFVEELSGQQLDQYSPNDKGVLLRPEVYGGRTLAAIGFAAHETGHAIQDAANYKYFQAHMWVINLATCGSLIGLILIIGGFLLVESILIYAGVLVFTTTVVAQLLNLVVEFDASRRVRGHLLETGVISPDEEPMVRRAMFAASCVSLASVWTSFPTAYRYLIKPRLPVREAAPVDAPAAAQPVLAAAGGRPAGDAVGGVAAAVERLRQRSRA